MSANGTVFVLAISVSHVFSGNRACMRVAWALFALVQTSGRVGGKEDELNDGLACSTSAHGSWQAVTARRI
jgi:hypothetical protein